jgi:hypothetical protein
MPKSMERLEGPGLVLRLIQPADAQYVHGLRINPAYNRHLSEVRGTAEDQRRWIEAYKAREAVGQEYYYVIERRDDTTRCGVVRLYDIKADHFTWGSWILDANKPSKAALESAVLSFGAGFDLPGISHALIDVRRANTHAEAFYRRFGMTEISANAQEIFFIYPRETFLRDRTLHLENVTREAR